MHTVRMRVVAARRMPHPSIPGLEKHYFLIKASELPTGIPLNANPRDANLNRRVYKQVHSSLLNETSEPGTFDLMNAGISTIANRVKRLSDVEYILAFEDKHGIANGGHTYELVQSAKSDGTIPDEQHVEMRVFTGVPDALIADIAKGLNTSMQVKEFAIENLRGNYDWIKALVATKPYANLIAWRENEDKPYDVVDLLCVLECLNVFDYPNNGTRHPVSAYEKSSLVIKSFADDAEAGTLKYERLGPILLNALFLYDVIRRDFRDVYNNVIKGKAGALKIVDKAPRNKPFKFPFSGAEESEFRLSAGAALPILAGFRALVEIDSKTKKARWVDNFGGTLDFWQYVKTDVVTRTHEAIGAYGRTPNVIGKARPHWSHLHLTLDRRFQDYLDLRTVPTPVSRVR
jgi:AIPR protein